MLYTITALSDPLCDIIRDDPVRPELPIEFRVSAHSNIFVLLDHYNKPTAAVCVAYRDSVPQSVSELIHSPHLTHNTAVFYTIWSYVPGAGRSLIRQTCQWIQQNKQCVTRFVTLSPPTDMARLFHLRNGAHVLSINQDTVNYIYS
jgi:hypothetical protein